MPCPTMPGGSTISSRPAKDADAELARAREGAQWAGDPDPYRKPADEWDEDAEGDEDFEDDVEDE